MKATKKSVYFTLAAVLLATAGLIVSCMNPLSPIGLTTGQDKQDKQNETPQPPAGMGYVMLNFGGEAGRTIRPDTSDYKELTDFDFFDVYFLDTDNPGTNDTKFLNRTPTTVKGPFTATSGNYEVHVFAYLSGGTSDDTSTAIAFGADTAVTVTGTGDTATIVLMEIADDEFSGTGTFKLNLTNASANAATVITMNIIDLSDNSKVIDGENIFSQLLTYEKDDLDPGYYRVEIILTRTGGLTTTVREVLHIYQGMTSTFTRTLPPVNTNVYTITYQFHNPPTNTANESRSITHGGYLQDPPTTDPTATNFYPGYNFLGWFTATIGGDEREVGVHQPIGNEIVHAQWESTGVTVTITVKMSEPGDPELEVTGFTNFTFDPATGTYTADNVSRASPPNNVTITITNNTDYDTFEWSISSDFVIDSSEIDTASITLDFGDIFLQYLGPVEFYATGYKGAIPYQSTVTITVEN